MFTGKTLGFLTVQLPDEDNRYIFSSEVSIPLLEGGLLYRGAFSPVDASDVMDVLVFANKSVLDMAHVDQEGVSEYVITLDIGNLNEQFNVSCTTAPEDPQQFYGLVENTLTNKRAKFNYKDIREPLVIGTTVLIVVGIAAVMCATNQIIGYFANRECRKVRVSYNFKFWGKENQQLGCVVECLE